jgi:myo-inositol 2-dehydrogenase/D-chiro-inositol 1-dehydrogenase
MEGGALSLAVGVIGTGVMGAEHARLLRNYTSGAHLAAVYDADAARAVAAASGAQLFSDPHALIAGDSVDAIVIASPDPTHAEYALAAIAAGKPVLCEKPIAATAADAMRIIEAETAFGRRLVQVGFMRRFDAAYLEIRQARLDRLVGVPSVLHNIHRNLSAPAWFTGAMVITNSFVHEIDISQWLLGSEIVAAEVFPAGDAGLLMIMMRTDKGEIVSSEMNINGGYGYHVHAQLVGSEGTVEMAAPARTLTNHIGAHAFRFPSDWVPRFAQAYQEQLRAWVEAIAAGTATGASAWDGYTTTLIADQIVSSLPGNRGVEIALPARPQFYKVEQE